MRRWVSKFAPCSPENFAIDVHGEPGGGISTKWWPRLQVGGSGFGARSTMKAKFSTCSCNDGATGAAVKLMRKLLKKHGFAPDVLVTDKLRSYGAAKSEIGLSARHEQGLRKNNRDENSHQPTRRRERKMQRFKSPGSAQRFLSIDAAVQNTFNVQRHLTSRARSGSSEKKHSRRGEPPPRREPILGLPIASGEIQFAGQSPRGTSVR